MRATARASVALGGRRIPAPFAAGCVLSLALHVVLLATARTSGVGRKAFEVPESPLQVLVNATSAPAASSLRPLPDRIEPLSNRRPRYTAMLPFSPAIMPAFDEQAYLPASDLTNPPTPVEEIRIGYPRGVHHLRVLTVALTLFIDERGHVENLRVEDPPLPEPYERAAVEAFADAKFRPGSDGVRPVKSRLRVRVAFDSGDSGETALAPVSGARS